MSGISLTGNKQLCGGIPQLHLPTCFNLQTGKQGKPLSAKVIIAITISVVACLASIVCFVFLYGKKKAKRKSSSTSFLGDGYLRVSYKDLLEVTAGFASSNLIGV